MAVGDRMAKGREAMVSLGLVEEDEAHQTISLR